MTISLKKLSLGAVLGSLLVSSIAFASSTGTIVPTSDGTYLQWTPSTGTTHYTLVDDSTCNGTTDYVSTNTTGNRDSYGVSLASIPTGATISAISIAPCASRNSNGSGSATLNVFYRYNGSNSSDTGSYAVTGTTPTQLSATNFAGLSFTKASTSTLEIGAVYSSGTKGARLSRLTTTITYLVPPTVTTNAASSIGTSTATLNGSANPNGLTSTGWFRYSSTSPSGCDDAFGIRAPTAGGTSLGSTSPTAFSRNITGLSTGTTYYYCAIASSTDGTSFGGVVSFGTTPLPPTSPSTLGATSTSGSQNDLGWKDNSSNEDSFDVQQSLNSSTGPFTHIATTSANAVSYGDTGLTSDQTYYYRVRAYNAGGYSGFSNTAYAVTATVVPSDPSGLTATASSTQINLSWSQSSTNEEGFRIERGTDGINFTEIGTRSINVISYSDSGLASTTTYYYRVRAHNAVGNSGYSATANATTP